MSDEPPPGWPPAGLPVFTEDETGIVTLVPAAGWRHPKVLEQQRRVRASFERYLRAHPEFTREELLEIYRLHGIGYL